jgi:hypothetical protein
MQQFSQPITSGFMSDLLTIEAITQVQIIVFILVSVIGSKIQWRLCQRRKLAVRSKTISIK